MSLTKKYLKTKPVCKVTFKLTPEVSEKIAKANLVGDFNNWDVDAFKMTKKKDGTFSRIVDLEVGKKYQFRYLIDGEHWINDEKADDYVPNGVSFESNCVVEL